MPATAFDLGDLAGPNNPFVEQRDCYDDWTDPVCPCCDGKLEDGFCPRCESGVVEPSKERKAA